MHCRKNDKDISIRLKKIYREDNIEQIRERERERKLVGTHTEMK